MSDCKCPRCGFDLEVPALARVTLVRGFCCTPTHLSGYFQDLEQLEKHGYCKRGAKGWFVPTDKLPSYVREV